jgi:hypothetical protein
MVCLSGLSVSDAQHPQGDIEIVCIGLRPGEKLYEELLIDAKSQPTTHPLIYRATERAIPPRAALDPDRGPGSGYPQRGCPRCPRCVGSLGARVAAGIRWQHRCLG